MEHLQGRGKEAQWGEQSEQVYEVTSLHSCMVLHLHVCGVHLCVCVCVCVCVIVSIYSRLMHLLAFIYPFIYERERP